MDAPAVSLVRKIAAMALAFALALSMAPAAWADDAPAGTLAGAMAGNATDEEAPGDGASADSGAVAPDDGQAPEADLQSADTAAADGGSGGTTISIAVYRSSFPIVKWDLNDDDYGLTEAEWAWENRTGELPKDASPGAEVAWPESGKPADYAEPTRAGFEFAGWSTDKSASAGGYIDGSSPKLAMPEGAPESKDYTLYALWTPVEYSVIFDLAKNPEDGNGPGSDASYALNWESDSGVNRTVTDLGNGRFRVDGFTMDERTYDATTRTVGLPEPSRTGYRFLGWSEPDGQRLAIDNAAKDGYALNPVRLTQIDGTPVLTARWTSAFGVTAPLSVTFGDYDKTGAPGNPWLGDKNSNAADDTTQSEADDTTKDERSGYEALGQAYFENTGWHEAVKVVGLSSERHASANQVLTTYDSKQASEAAVLGDGTEANPGERLLSLYPSASAPVDKSSGVHFRLSDSLDETALGNSFTMGAQGSGSEKLPITYGLNLSTDPSDGSANHGLVLPTNDYERKQIATVSYTFATATAASSGPLPNGPRPSGSASDALWVENTNADWGPVGVYGLEDIQDAASDLSEHADDPTASGYYAFYRALLDAQMTSNGNPGPGPYFQMKVDGVYLPVQLIGICQDTKSSGGKAGLTFQMRDLYAYGNQRSNAAGGGTFTTAMNASSTNGNGWQGAALSSRLRTTFLGYLDPALQSAIVTVDKRHQLPGGTNSNFCQATTGETLWLPSAFEVFGGAFANFNESEGVAVAGFAPFQYLAYQGNDGTDSNRAAIKQFNGGNIAWWLRSAYRNSTIGFCLVGSAGDFGGANPYAANKTFGVAPAFCL